MGADAPVGALSRNLDLIWVTLCQFSYLANEFLLIEASRGYFRRRITLRVPLDVIVS